MSLCGIFFVLFFWWYRSSVLSMISVKAGLYSILSHKATGVISIYLSMSVVNMNDHTTVCKVPCGSLVSCRDQISDACRNLRCTSSSGLRLKFNPLPCQPLCTPTLLHPGHHHAPAYVTPTDVQVVCDPVEAGVDSATCVCNAAGMARSKPWQGEVLSKPAIYSTLPNTAEAAKAK
jgi:hypothetical protein